MHARLDQFLDLFWPVWLSTSIFAWSKPRSTWSRSSLTHRHRAMGLLLSELGGYLLGQANLSGLAPSALVIWCIPTTGRLTTINAVLWQQKSSSTRAGASGRW